MTDASRMRSPDLGKLGRRAAAGATFAVALAASPAMASCVGTGALAGLGSQFLPFAAGGAVSSLVSAINAANTAFLTQSTAFVGAPGNPAPDQEGGGVWVRGIGGEVTTKSTATTSGVSFAGVALPGDINCATENRLSFSGVQMGSDMARLNWNGWNVHVGSMIGYLGAKSRDISAAGPLNPLGGTFQDTLQVPFAGMYVAATRGGFFADGQVRFDYYQNKLSDPVVGGIFDQKLDARGYAISGNIGYNHQLGNNWFIEPSAGIVVSRVSVDPLNVTGALVTGTGLTLPGQLVVDDIRSTLGRLSLRAGTTIVSGNMAWQPFATASVYHEFEGGATASFNGDAFAAIVPGVNMNGNLRMSSIGTYGQFGLGVAGQMLNTGWLGYLRADYRTGQNIDGYSVNGGIRYQFSPEQIASISPLYTKAAKAPAIARTVYDWSGFFVGISGGVMAGKTDYYFPASLSSTSPRYAGLVGGGQVGYDWQIGKWVVGLEGNIHAGNAHGARACPNNVFYTCETDMDWLGTATARLGYAYWDRSLVYVRAGAAFGNTKITGNCNTGPFNVLGFTNCGTNESRSATGWTVGFGSEFALTRNWTVRTETNYYDLGTTRYNLPTGALPAFETVDVRNSGIISTVGLNYRFSADPVTTRF